MLKQGLTKPPPRIASLPVDPRGYPVPWFVEKVNGEYDFRVMSQEKFIQAVNFKRCWVCGEPLGIYVVFVAGPMCGINRTVGDPPSHADCAEWSAINCPFLSRPKQERNEHEMPENYTQSKFHLRRNPGVAMLWATRSYQVFMGDANQPLFRIGNPAWVRWYCEGRMATRAEVLHSVDTGLPALEKLARMQDDAEDGRNQAVTTLDRMVSAFKATMLPET